MKTSTPGVQPTLLFIPDISGFTKFVSETAIEHSQHIIEELLEILIEANDIDMQISEIEGDAILFFRVGKAPTAAQLLAQVQKMFIAFHGHLKMYETHRICACGACKGAHQLSLKFVVHYGPISQNQIKSHRKLFGKDLIVAHRLLKNRINHHEYALFTDGLVKACSTWVDVPAIAWTGIENGDETYDSGQINYCFLNLTPLMDYVPEPKLEDHSIPGVKKHVFHLETQVNAPIETVFNVVADLKWRVKWMPETLEETQDLNHKILQNGNTHRCRITGPAVVTHDFKSNHDTITYTETDIKRSYCLVFTLKRRQDGGTTAATDFFLKKNLLMNTLFKLLAKKRVKSAFAKSWEVLNDHCTKLVESGQAHPYHIVLETRAKPKTG